MDKLFFSVYISKDSFSCTGLDVSGKECFSASYAMNARRFSWLLMEVTHLCGDITKKLPYSWSSIKDKTACMVYPSFSKVSLPCRYTSIDFVLYFLCTDVLLQARWSHNTCPEASPEECCISNKNNRLRDGVVLCSWYADILAIRVRIQFLFLPDLIASWAIHFLLG